MSFSKIDLCNMALGQAGSTAQIQTLSPAAGTATPQAVTLCNLYFPLAVEAAARSHCWGCLQKAADLSAAITTAPAFGFTYAYSLPSDYIGWLRFEDEDALWRRVGRTIHTDETTVQVWYVARTEDTTLFDALFAEALVMRLAAMLAAALGGENGPAKADALRKWHESVTAPGARFADSVENNDEETYEDSEWLDARQS